MGIAAGALGRWIRRRGGRPVVLATLGGGGGLTLAAALVRIAILG